ncbi:intradiol ring-cleavage dioxygenase [Rhodobacteraceae bacterium F11138]|nr:intradiol ring-cleavage dioxygenase [Rhodobacteraceae bacterium F11138]
MRNVTVENVTDVVVNAIGASHDLPARNKEIMTALVRHLHDFCKEVNLSSEEFMNACDFLARAGAVCSDKRQEFILLSDILGVEVLVDMLSNPTPNGETTGTVLGPFFRENAPVLPHGASIVQKHFDNEETVFVDGYVKDADGNPVAQAVLDVWEDAPNGLYENHDPEQPDYNLRGRFETDENGYYCYRAIRPVPYPIPSDWTAGEMISYMGHHTMRPGHIHVMITKPGFRTLVSQLYDSSSEHLDNDAVFAVKEDLIGDFSKGTDEMGTDLYVKFDFTLAAEATAMAAE